MTSVANSEKLMSSVAEFAAATNIDRPTATRILGEVLKSVLLKRYRFTEEGPLQVVVNTQGDLQIFLLREIVEDGSPEAGKPDKIALAEAHMIEPDFEVGESVATEIDLRTFTRREATEVRERLQQKRRELEIEQRYQHYKKKEKKELVAAHVGYVKSEVAVLYDDKHDPLFLPADQQIPREVLRPGAPIYAVVHEVNSREEGRVQVILSRRSEEFLRLLLRQEISEIQQNKVRIMAVERRAGERAKVSVFADDDRIDPVGACLGPGGRRIRDIAMKYGLGREQIDIVGYTENPELYVRRALSPAQVKEVALIDNRFAVYLPSDQVALAIGTNGQNVDLAGRLVGYPIDIYQEIQAQAGDERRIENFLPTLSRPVVDALKQAGIETREAVLALGKKELARRTGLPPAAAEQVYEMLARSVPAE